MNKVYLLLGGNIENRFEYLTQACKQIEKKVGKILNKSSIYESEPWGFKTETFFLNQVLEVETELSPRNLLLMTQSIERLLGREKKTVASYTNRTIDIDILFYGNEIYYNKDLSIPHVQLHKRRFTLLPLVELCPKYIHPLLQESVETLLENCSDKGNPIKLDEIFEGEF